jgi:hypothetical protein
MTNWLKLVAAIIVAEAVEHTVEWLFDLAKRMYARVKRRRDDKKYYSRR